MNRFEISLERIKKWVFPQNNWTDEDFEHIKTVTDALEKQIPKKVIEESLLTETVDGVETEIIGLRFCPNCGVRFLRIGHGYCGECGQALEWGDE